jgi:trk system potassium uptake protein TrkH
MQKDVLMLDSTAPISLATKIMKRRGQENVVVIKAGVPVGIVTDQDIIDNLAEKGVSPFGSSLSMIMSSPLITIEPDASIKDALAKMRDSKVRKLVVVEDGFVKGIITQAMIASAIRSAVITKPRGIHPTIKSIFGNLGLVLQFAGILFVVPALLSTFMNEPVPATGIYLLSVTLLACGFFLNSYGEKAPLNLRQGSILVLSGFVVLSLIGMIPYIYLNPFNATDIGSLVADSFFESASGLTTTGLSILPSVDELPQSFVFYRSYTQWVGGLSFIYLVMSLFYPESKIAAMRGFLTGQTLHLRELFATITIIFTIYTALVTTILFALGSTNTINDIALILSTLSTGGWVPSSAILPSMGHYSLIAIISTMILGALPFTYHYLLIKRKLLTPRVTKEIAIFLLILAVSTGLFPLISGLDPFIGTFHAISAATTTGFQLIDMSVLNDGAKAYLILLMFVGGTAFSTAGGIKVLRLISVADFILNVKNREKRARINIENVKEFVSAVLIIILFPTLAYIAASHMTGQGYDFIDAYFDSTAAVTNGGLSAGIVTADLDATSKIILTVTMIVGRFEIIAILYIFVPRLMQ